MSPGECIVQDRGELCNKIAKLLADKFNCPIRVISAGRPQANGQAEAYQEDVDISGTELTQPLADALNAIHNEAFGKAGGAIKKWQQRYSKAYDKKHKSNPLKLRKASKIQVYDYSAKKSVNYKKGAMKCQWKPFGSYFHVHSIDRKKGVVTVRSKGGRIYKKRHPINRVRLYKGKN